MYTQCPACLTVFSLDATTLTRARGQVVCGHCGEGFDSIATLTGHLPPEPFVELAANTQAAEPPMLELAIYRPRPPPPTEAGEPDSTPGAESEDFTQLVFAPRFARAGTARRARRVRQRSRERRWPWILLCGALFAALLLQLAWAERDALVASPSAGGWLRRACHVVGCRLPLVRDVRRLRLAARDVQAHPSVPNALVISATVRNEAPFAQPYPVVTLVLADANGQRIAMRRLRPEEYLGDEAQLRAGLAPGANAAVLFEVDDPGERAVAFDFSFE